MAHNPNPLPEDDFPQLPLLFRRLLRAWGTLILTRGSVFGWIFFTIRVSYALREWWKKHRGGRDHDYYFYLPIWYIAT